MTKTTSALKLAEEAAEFARNICLGMNWSTDLPDEALAAIREALADHSGDANEMVMDWSKVKPEAIKSDPMYQMGYAAAKAEPANTRSTSEYLEPVRQEPVAHYKDAPHTIYLQTGCDDPEDCDCSFNEWSDTTWCADQIRDTDIPYIRADYAAPVQPVKQEPVATVVKPWSYGGTTGVHDYLMSDGSIRALTPDEARAINAAPVDAKAILETERKRHAFELSMQEELFADKAEAIRVEALEEAAKVCEKAMIQMNYSEAPYKQCAAAIRELK